VLPDWRRRLLVMSALMPGLRTFVVALRRRSDGRARRLDPRDQDPRDQPYTSRRTGGEPPQREREEAPARSVTGRRFFDVVGGGGV